MKDAKAGEPAHCITLDYDLGELPEKVWRAISVAEFRETWLPDHALADPEAEAVTPGREIRYRMRDDAPPFLESTVTFLISPNGSGGTRLRVIHVLTDARLTGTATAAANDNGLRTRLAA